MWMASPTGADYVDKIFYKSSGLTGRELFTGLFSREEEDQFGCTPKKGSHVMYAGTSIYVLLSVLVRTLKWGSRGTDGQLP